LRLVSDGPNASTKQTLELDLEIGSEVPAALYHVDVTCGAVKGYGDSLSMANNSGAPSGAHRMKEALAVMGLQFVTKGDYDSLVPQTFTFNGTPKPSISGQITSSSLAADGTLTLTLAGTVNDVASDLVDVPEKQLSSLTISSGPIALASVTLVNAGVPEMPWKPYRFKAVFSNTISIPVVSYGTHTVRAETSLNVAGEKAIAEIPVQVVPKRRLRSYNIQVPGVWSSTVVDAVSFYVGAQRAVTTADRLTETGVNTQIFLGTLPWASVQVAPIAFNGLTAAIDQMNVTMRFAYAGGSAIEVIRTFAETGATTGHFVYSESIPLNGPELGGSMTLVCPTAFNASMIDTVQVHMGELADAGSSYPLNETALGSKVFNGDCPWGDTTIDLSVAATLTNAVDTLVITSKFTDPESILRTVGGSFTETGAMTGTFVIGLGPIQRDAIVPSDFSSGGTGTFLPSIVRLALPAGTYTESQLAVRAFDRKWKLLNINFGDGPFAYVVDDQYKPVVFLPSKNAHTHIQTKPLPKRVFIIETVLESETDTEQIFKDVIKIIPVVQGLRLYRESRGYDSQRSLASSGA